uniref:Diacylglycerol kinase theta-like n=1 Tax=Nicotiana tabacum TaxID=4097 RepID=A0A1S4D252_TOBAC|nr:PREDICTED: diacylglycerol kinase theta-like [Nicotiana tabacum]
MAPLRQQHEHPITIYDDANNTKYLCEGCMIPGSGKRYHCHDCNFNLHEHCGTCPPNLSSFMHPYHSLKLVERNHLRERFCNVCRDTIEGLSYRCELCEFDVHPLCTQLPETLRHALHKHPLRLLGSSEAGKCAVCSGECDASSWRYRCALCGFDIHMGCVPIQCEKKMTDRGIPMYVPPSLFPHHQQQYFGVYAYGNSSTPYWNPTPNYSPGPSNMQHYNYMPHPPLHLQHHCQGQAQTYFGGGIGQIMFELVKALVVGVMTNMIFGA